MRGRRTQRTKRRKLTAPVVVAAGAVGAALQYFTDPAMGRSRRAQSKDRVAAMVRRPAKRAERRFEQKSEWLQDRARGLLHEATKPRGAEWPENDQTLVDKVRSEVLGREDWRRYTINVDVARGVVTLRGQVDTPEEIHRLEDEVAKVTGVAEVVNLSHLPDTAPPKEPPASVRRG
jgi:osmotically-inducible protein OsmY